MTLSSSSTTPRSRRARSEWQRRCALAALLVPITYSGCSVDERTLALNSSDAGAGAGAGAAGRTAGRAGSPSAGDGAGGRSPVAGRGAGGSAGQPEQAGQAGQAGEADGGAPSFPDGCADLDRNGKSDCTQTLLQNPAFATTVNQWTAEAGALLMWDPRDLMLNPDSGSARVTLSGAIDAAGNSQIAVYQCIKVSAASVLEIDANAVLDPGVAGGAALIGLWYYPVPDCPGGTSLFYETPSLSDADTTLHLHGIAMVPPQMVSALVRLSVVKPFRAETFSVRFDNVLVSEL